MVAGSLFPDVLETWIDVLFYSEHKPYGRPITHFAELTNVQEASEDKPSDISNGSSNEDHMRRAVKQTSPFFKIPGELRNEIYRLALVKPANELTEITSSGYEVPPFLNVCKQTRFEALKIFYNENKFETVIYKYDCGTWIKFAHTMEKLDLNIEEMQFESVTCHDEPNWSKLVEWVRQVHVCGMSHSPSYPTQLEQPASSVHYAVGSLFAIAERLDGLPWELMKSIVEDLRPNLTRIDKQWGDD